MAFIDMEDLYGNVEVIVFPNIYERYLHMLNEDAIVVIKGSVNFKEDEAPKLIAEYIFGTESLDLLESGAGHEKGQVKIRVPDGFDEEDILEKIKEIIMEHKGGVPVVIYLNENGKKLKTARELWVDPDDGFKLKVETLIGKENIKIE